MRRRGDRVSFMAAAFLILVVCSACSPKTSVYPTINYAAKIPETPTPYVDLGSNNFYFTKLVEATYPQKARQRGIRGSVIVLAKVGSDGRVVNAWIDAGIHPLVDQEALKATRLCTFGRKVARERPQDETLSLIFRF